MADEIINKETSSKEGDFQSPGVISYKQFATLLDSKLLNMKYSLAREIKTELNSALEKFKLDFSATTEFLSNQICDLQKEVTCHTTKLKDLETENLNLKKSINQLQLELNLREQGNLSSDLQISGIPEYENESLTHIITTVAAKLQVNINEQDIATSMRVGPKRPANNLSSGAHSFRSRPIAVRLARRSTRDELLKNARVRRGCTSGDLGLPSHEVRRVYINERLTRINRQIFTKAREAARAARWRFVWTKDGRIFARRAESSDVHMLQTEEDIDKIFNCNNISHDAE
ncbi:uncharacterized protein LOC128199358 [Bicyclus anynana]|uniref:Uncharacterized protein LOC128199358 n=1 Tax=Bicyclus anynana TaxID=110368 RepID=A0ABM3LZL9_BICAN|nr:uncharacterized protein LOC128199358 [Bicyclus anynana]